MPPFPTSSTVSPSPPFVADVSPSLCALSKWHRPSLPFVSFIFLHRLSHLFSQATRFIEQGHVRVGPHTITDPAFLVTRHMQDFVTWVDSSKLKRTVLLYNDQLDDFALL